MATQATRTAKEGGRRVPGRALPLNSRRLTAAVMCRIVEGKLGELGHPLENVRV